MSNVGSVWSPSVLHCAGRCLNSSIQTPENSEAGFSKKCCCLNSSIQTSENSSPSPCNAFAYQKSASGGDYKYSLWQGSRMRLGVTTQSRLMSWYEYWKWVKVKVVKWCQKKWNEHNLMYICHKQCEIMQKIRRISSNGQFHCFHYVW